MLFVKIAKYVGFVCTVGPYLMWSPVIAIDTQPMTPEYQ